MSISHQPPLAARPPEPGPGRYLPGLVPDVSRGHAASRWLAWDDGLGRPGRLATVSVAAALVIAAVSAWLTVPPGVISRLLHYVPPQNEYVQTYGK